MSIVASHHTITIAGMAHLKRTEIIDGWDGGIGSKKTGLLCSELGDPASSSWADPNFPASRFLSGSPASLPCLARSVLEQRARDLSDSG
jgi:hypothetical protein